MKVADLFNHSRLGGLFSDEDLCRMATSNPADAIGWSDRLGRLRAGLHADLVVVARREEDVYRNLVTSIEADVCLVMIDGYPMYGVDGLMRAGAAVNPEPIDVGGSVGRRTVSLRDERIEDADMSWPEVVGALEEIRADAHAAHEKSLAATGEHLALIPDKPWDDPTASGPPVDLGVRIGPLDSLVADDAYFDAIARATDAARRRFEWAAGVLRAVGRTAGARRAAVWPPALAAAAGAVRLGRRRRRCPARRRAEVVAPVPVWGRPGRAGAPRARGSASLPVGSSRPAPRRRSRGAWRSRARVSCRARPAQGRRRRCPRRSWARPVRPARARP